MSEPFEQRGRGPSRRGVPVPVGSIIGLLCLLLCVATSLLEIEASEAFFLGGKALVTFSPDLSILAQPLLLFSGNLSSLAVEAIVFAWVIEAVYLVCIVNFELARDGLVTANPHIERWFTTGIIACIAIDVWTNYNYGPGTIGNRLAFALIAAMAVAFLGVIGIHFIVHDIRALGART